jgi:hypothetical protein
VAECPEDGQGDGRGIGRGRTLTSAQRLLERTLLDCRQFREHAVLDPSKEVGEDGKGQLGLGFGRPRDEHRVALADRLVDHRRPDGRLAEARLAHDQQAGRPIS